MNIKFTDDKGKTRFGTVEDKYLEVMFNQGTNYTKYLISEYNSGKAYTISPNMILEIYASYVHMQQDAIKLNK